MNKPAHQLSREMCEARGAMRGLETALRLSRAYDAFETSKVTDGIKAALAGATETYRRTHSAWEAASASESAHV